MSYSTFRFRSFDTAFKGLKDSLTDYLIENNIYFELSVVNVFCKYHFDIKCNDQTVAKINDYLNSITIYCKGV